jgi:hypothetical protein
MLQNGVTGVGFWRAWVNAAAASQAASADEVAGILEWWGIYFTVSAILLAAVFVT